MSAATHAIRYPATPLDFTWSCCHRGRTLGRQSRRNFETVSKLVVPGAPLSSLFLLMPLVPEAGGMADTHQGGRQFASQDDSDWKNMEAWVRGQKASGSSAP